MWHMMHSSRSQLLPDDTFVSIHLASKTQVGVGLKDVAAAQLWLLRAKFELEVMRLNIKKEQSNEAISDFVDGSNNESTASTQSAHSRSDKTPTLDEMVLYDIPPGLQKADIVEIIKNKDKAVSTASRLSSTLGPMPLNGAVVRDPARRQPMYTISLA